MAPEDNKIVKENRSLAILSELGIDREIDLKAAMEYWKTAAKLGDVWSKKRLKELEERLPIKEDDAHLEHILIADDDSAIRDNLSKIISQLNARPITAMDGVEALEITQKYNIKAIILDLKMPRMNGIEFLKKLQQTGFFPKVVICTGYDTENNRKALAEMDIFKWIKKPTGTQEFIDVIRAIQK